MCQLVVRFLLMTVLADLLICASVYSSESSAISRNSVVVPVFKNFSLFMPVFNCVS